MDPVRNIWYHRRLRPGVLWDSASCASVEVVRISSWWCWSLVVVAQVSSSYRYLAVIPDLEASQVPQVRISTRIPRPDRGEELV
jgi:hypothetical protein